MRSWLLRLSQTKCQKTKSSAQVPDTLLSCIHCGALYEHSACSNLPDEPNVFMSPSVNIFQRLRLGNCCPALSHQISCQSSAKNSDLPSGTFFQGEPNHRHPNVSGWRIWRMRTWQGRKKAYWPIFRCDTPTILCWSRVQLSYGLDLTECSLVIGSSFLTSHWQSINSTHWIQNHLEHVFFLNQCYILITHQTEVYEDLLDVLFVLGNQTTSAAWSS